MIARSVLVAATLCGTAVAITNATPDSGHRAVVMLVDAMGTPVCTGVVIDAHVILTAAHCQIDASNFDQFGALIPPPSPQNFDFAGALVHPQYDASTFAHDLTLLTVREASIVAPLPLDARPVDTSLVGQSFTVVGFGSTSAMAADTGIKRSGTAQVTAVGDFDFTADGAPSQPCVADSGGPALFSDNSMQVVTGLVSHGDADCSDHAVFSRVDVARADFIDPWIQSLMTTLQTGDRCYFDEQCAGGPCLTAADETRRAFCSQTCSKDVDCPSGMSCAADGCRWKAPSPGALGSSCSADGDCDGGMCRAATCTRTCVPTQSDCPSGLSCQDQMGIQFVCLRQRADVQSGCAVGGNDGGGWIMVAGWSALILLSRRRRWWWRRPAI